MKPLGPCTLLLFCFVVFPANAHAQCTRSCGQTPPDIPVTLYSFAGPPDGAVPLGVLVRDASGNFYGSTSQGGVTGGACGSNGCGVIFKMKPNGAETLLYSFLGGTDGATPTAGLVLDGSGNLYGTTSKGGTSNRGTVFKIDTAGHETVLYSFTGGPDGSTPMGDLMRDQLGNLYGTASAGGTGGGTTGGGVAFKLDTNGVQTVLHNFASMTGEGFAPIAGMVQDSSGNFYGTTSEGGTVNCMTEGNFRHAAGCGTVFTLSSTGAGSVLFHFNGGNDGPDGAFPGGTLLRDSSGNLFGTTSWGGPGAPCYIIGNTPPMLPLRIHCGTVFKVDSSGTESLLHKFTGGLDGAVPQGKLIQDTAGNLYGITSDGGNGGCTESGPRTVPVDIGCGTIFKIDTSGVESVLAIFKIAAAGGIHPQAGLLADSSGNLFGTTSFGGVSNFGTVYTVTSALPPSPDFSVTPVSPTLTIDANKQGTDTITIAPLNGSFASVIQLSCTVTGPAPTPACVLNPASVTPGSASVSSTLTITTPPASAWSLPKLDKNPNWLSRRPDLQWREIMLAATILILIISLMLGQKRQLRYALGFVALTILAGCGGGGGTITLPHIPASYTVSVIGNAPNTTQSHTAQVIVTVP